MGLFDFFSNFLKPNTPVNTSMAGGGGGLTGLLGGMFKQKTPVQTSFSGRVSAPADIGQSTGSGFLGSFANALAPGVMNLFTGPKSVPGVSTGYGTLGTQPFQISSPYSTGPGVVSGFRKDIGKSFVGPGPRTPTPSTGGGLGGLLSNFNLGNIGSWMGNNKGLLGTALIGAGMFKGLPKAPEIPESVNALRQQIESGGSPYAQDAAKYYQSQLNREFDPLTDEEIQARLRQVDEQMQDEADYIRDAYKNIRPGADIENDSAFRRDMSDLNQKYARIKQDTIGLATRDIRNQLDAQQMGAAGGLGALGQQDIAQLMQLAQLDVDQLAMQLGIDLQQATFIKSTLANLGTAMIAPSLNPIQALMTQWLMKQSGFGI